MAMSIRWLKSNILGWRNKVAGKPESTGGKGCVSDRLIPMAEPRTLGALVPEMESDSQVAFLKHIITANVSAVRVSISIEGADDPKAKGIAKKLEELWQRSIVSMMGAYGYGRQAFEKTFDYDPCVPCSYVKRLEPIEFSDSTLRLTPEHKYDGFDVILNPDEPEKTVQIPPENSWWLALDATPRNPHGRSQYRGAVQKVWQDKRENLRNLKMFVRRFAIRGGVVHGPMTATDEQTQIPYSVPEKFQEAVEALYNGGTLYLPNDAHSDPQMAQAGKYAYEFAEASTTMLDPTPILTVIDRNDVDILRAGGVPEKAAIEGDGTGSYAQLTQQMLTLFARIDSLVSQLTESFQSYVADHVARLNYGDDSRPRFRVVAVKLTNRPDSFVVELLKQLAANPQFVQMMLSGGVNLRAVLETVGLPVSPELEQVAAQVAAQFAATMGGAGAPGVQPGQGGGGEFQGLGRRQLTNNVKAIRDILDDLIAGKSTPAFAQQLLESLGITPDRASKMIRDAADGSIDESLDDPGAVTMANTLAQQQRMFSGLLTKLKKKSMRKR